MNNVLEFPNEVQLREQAGAWIARIDRGLGTAEHAELARWIEEDPRHRDALFEMAELWDRMDILSEISELFPLQSRPFSWAWFTTTQAVAVSLSLILVAAIWSGWSLVRGVASQQRFAARGAMAPQTIRSTYTTSVGEQRTITLPDLSVVTLNTATVLRVNYTNTDRTLELEKGEAHFEVKKDASRVFSVRVGLNEFSAVGTAFDIRVKSEKGIELTVTEGRVRVRVPTGGAVRHSMEAVASQSSPTEIMVDAGKEVAIDNMKQTVELLQPARIEAALAWKRGMIVFDAESLENAIREVSRYSNTRFIIADQTTKNLPVSGYFKVGDIDGLVAALHNNFDIDATREGDVIVLSSRR
jgi:transmembrane sensor